MKTRLNRGLYAISPPDWFVLPDFTSRVEQILMGGCRVLQFRDKHSEESQRLEQAKTLVELCHRFQAQLIINDDVELCLAAGADGVHLGKTDGDLSSARARLGTDKILGVTCHNDLAYAQSAIAKGADYCAFGRIFVSQTKPNAPPCEISILEQALQLSVPIVAIGGITLDNMPTLMQTPLNHVAVIQGLFGSTNLQDTARLFQAYFNE